MICFYHSGDLDGHCSGAIVKMKHPKCKMIGINYGDPFPWEMVKGQKIIMVDFSLQPFTEMLKLFSMENIKSILWIDHHKSVIDDFMAIEEVSKANVVDLLIWDNGTNKVKAMLNIKFAACELTWFYFFPGKNIPTAAHLLGRYDVWDHADHTVMPFQWGVRSAGNTDPNNQKFWAELFSRKVYCKELLKEGETILKFRDIENAKYLKGFAFETTFDGYSALAVNRGLTNSIMFDSCKNKYDLFITFAYKKGQWDVLLYSKGKIDVSLIAKEHGGGGHANAAGFKTDKITFLK